MARRQGRVWDGSASVPTWTSGGGQGVTGRTTRDRARAVDAASATTSQTTQARCHTGASSIHRVADEEQWTTLRDEEQWTAHQIRQRRRQHRYVVTQVRRPSIADRTIYNLIYSILLLSPIPQMGCRTTS